MDRLLNQDYICSISSRENLPEDEHIDPQFERILPLDAEQFQTNQSLPLFELNNENIPLIDDQFDDDPLLVIPSTLPNNSKHCSGHCLEIVVGCVLCTFVLTILLVGFLIALGSKTPRAPNIGCDQRSKIGQSCSTKDLQTTILISLKNPSFSQYTPYSFIYTGQANRSVITFSFTKGGGGYYIDDISIIEPLNHKQVLEDGGFESGTLYRYCLCDSTVFENSKSHPKQSSSHSGDFALEIQTFFSTVTLSQTVHTVMGRSYNISFWLQNRGGLNNHLTVYMSSAYKTHQSFASVLFTTIFLTFLKSFSY